MAGQMQENFRVKSKKLYFVYGNSKGFEVKVGMHQGSALSPLLFMFCGFGESF